MDTKLMQRFVDDLSAAGLPPCVLMARIEPEGYPSAECQSRVSIGVKVGRRLGAFDSAVGDCIERSKWRYNGTSGVRLDYKSAIGRFGDVPGKTLR
jgi:hypothetical protein